MPAGMMDGGQDEAAAKLKRMIFITDAMRTDELDSDGLIFVSPAGSSQSCANPPSGEL
jgi:signal recognition particle subunit SRP54